MFIPRHQIDNRHITRMKETNLRRWKQKSHGKKDVRVVHSSYTVSWRDFKSSSLRSICARPRLNHTSVRVEDSSRHGWKMKNIWNYATLLSSLSSSPPSSSSSLILDRMDHWWCWRWFWLPFSANCNFATHWSYAVSFRANVFLDFGCATTICSNSTMRAVLTHKVRGQACK